jgi:glucosylceramidase
MLFPMTTRLFRSRFLGGALALLSVLVASAGEPLWFSSTADDFWERMPTPAFERGVPAAAPEVTVVTRRVFQEMEGFGGCFNEAGWAALEKASESDRAEVIAALFGDEGCAFARARVPIGASDFALSAYSLAEVDGDFELRHFSIERDRRHLLPFIKAAMAVRPGLEVWGSPWSPPEWMKTSRSYSKGSLRWEPEILRSYANYFVRWIEAYRAEGVNVYAVAPQNEPNILSPYPSCLWTGPQLREFIGDHLGPALRDAGSGVELWLGLNGDPFNGGENLHDRLLTVMEDARASSFVAGVAYQYDSRNQIAVASQLYPDKKYMQSETVCNGGANSWEDAQRLYGLMKRYIDGGAGSYFAWNMVLDDTGMSTWNWKQNALVTVDRETGEVTYNGEFYVMRHFSRYVKPGARRVLSAGVWGDQIAFLNPDGSVVAVVGNSADRAYGFSLAVSGSGRAETPVLKVELPARSINTFVIPAAVSAPDS